ncbi:MAG: hypothetical protein JRG76_18155, partial [Deltaproteobacteria bacterium]|nr:hypothetical protein [Deltaproteobacteria bacterium]
MSAVPNWDMTPYFPEFGGEVYRNFWAGLRIDLDSLLADVRAAPPISDASLDAWAALLGRVEDASLRTRHLSGYLGCIAAADALDQAIQRDTARVASLEAELQKVNVAVRAALRDLDDATFDRLTAHASLSGAAYHLTRLRRRAQWSMSEDLETLAADLAVTGIHAWGRLYGQVSGKLEFDLAVDGQETRRLPVSMTRTFLEDADPAVRRAALDGGNAAWRGVADVTAACINGIAGTRLELYRRRGIEHFLVPAVFDAGITRKTLDAMWDAVQSRAEIARRYLRRKAKLLGSERLGFQDLMAPLPISSQRRVPWDEGRAQILDAFGARYPALRDFAAETFERRRIDYEPRP